MLPVVDDSRVDAAVSPLEAEVSEPEELPVVGLGAGGACELGRLLLLEGHELACGGDLPLVLIYLYHCDGADAVCLFEILLFFFFLFSAPISNFFLKNLLKYELNTKKLTNDLLIFKN